MADISLSWALDMAEPGGGGGGGDGVIKVLSILFRFAWPNRKHFYDMNRMDK